MYGYPALKRYCLRISLISELAMPPPDEDINRLLTTGRPEKRAFTIFHNLECSIDITSAHFIIGITGSITQEFNGHQYILVWGILPIEQFYTLMKINVFMFIVSPSDRYSD